MFPSAPSTSSRIRRRLRQRLVAGLDVAIEFATLGEYGVEEVVAADPADDGDGWGWPPAWVDAARGGVADRSRAATAPRRRDEACVLPAAAGRGAGRERGGSVDARPAPCAAADAPRG